MENNITILSPEDRKHLEFIRNRMVIHYGESENTDYIKRLDAMLSENLTPRGVAKAINYHKNYGQVGHMAFSINAGIQAEKAESDAEKFKRLLTEYKEAGNSPFIAWKMAHCEMARIKNLVPDYPKFKVLYINGENSILHEKELMVEDNPKYPMHYVRVGNFELGDHKLLLRKFCHKKPEPKIEKPTTLLQEVVQVIYDTEEIAEARAWMATFIKEDYELELSELLANNVKNYSKELIHGLYLELPNTDSLANYEIFPEEVQNILLSLTGDQGYKESAQVVEDLEKLGFTADYGLDAQLSDLRTLELYKG